MRLYLEIKFERKEEKEELETLPEEIIRLEIKSKDAALKLYETLKYAIADRPHKPYLHICFHDEEEPRPCHLEPIAAHV